MLGAALALAAPSLLPRRAAGVARWLARRNELRIGLLLRTPADSFADPSQGLTLGAEESARTAALFGLDVAVIRPRLERHQDAERAARELVAEGVAAVVSASDTDGCEEIRAVLAEARVLVLSLSCDGSVGRRDEPCRSLAFYISPSGATIRRARASFARRRGPAQGEAGPPVLWHHTLTRFGAAQLNDRFRRRFGDVMTSPAWAGWAAMKILTESALRSRSARGVDIARYMTSLTGRFDGHKGEPLSFDARSGELRQPLYVIAGEGSAARVVAELSTAEAYEAPNGTGRGATPCPARRAASQ
jgi:hypothetical protein